MSELNEVLQLIASQTKADAQQLIDFAAEDTIGGFHIDESQRKWPVGSLYEVEGQILYALIRYFKPESVVQIGGWAGCSAAHLALAVKANGVGHVTSVDNGGDGNTEHGNLLPAELQKYVTLIWANGEDWLAAQPDHSIGLLFEDASHATELVEKLARLAFTKIVPGGLMVNHDAAHDFAIVGGGQRIYSPVGVAIRDGLTRAGVYYRVYRAEPSDCGIALTVMPGARQTIDVTPANQDRLSSWPPVDLSKYTSEQMWEAAEKSGKVYDDYQGDDKFVLTAEDMDRIGLKPEKTLPEGLIIGNANIESLSEPPPVEKKPAPKTIEMNPRRGGKATRARNAKK